MTASCYCHCPSLPRAEVPGEFTPTGKPKLADLPSIKWQADVAMSCPDPRTINVTADPACPRCGSPHDLSVISRAA